MAVIRSPTVMSFLQQIRSPKTRYFELPTGEHGQRSSEPRSSWRKPIFLGFLAIFCILGIWSLSRTGLPSRISGQGLAGENKSESQESETSSNNTKGLVIASYTAQNVSWLSAIPSEWQVFRYYMDDPNPPNGLSVPRNQGREAMAYLTYIIDHYDDLPKYIVFTHGHYRSWHQIEPLPAKIRALNLTALSEENYISLRCGNQMGCERQPYLDTQHPNWDGEKGLRSFWKTLLPQYDVPQYLSFKCCAQFAVTREMVLRRPRSEWIQIREPFMHEISGYGFGQFSSDWVIGTFYEKYWHVLLGPSPENCPPIDKCHMNFFSNAILCDRPIDYANFEGDGVWEDVQCVSAYDGLSPDEAPDMEKWNSKILSTYGELKKQRQDLDQGRKDKLHDYETLEAQKHADTATAPHAANDRPVGAAV